MSLAPLPLPVDTEDPENLPSAKFYGQAHLPVVPDPTQPRGVRRVRRRVRPWGGVRQSTVLEASVKLTVNLLLGTVAASTLARLVPHYRIQAAELVSLEQATDQLSHENHDLWQEFSRNFAPEQVSNLMREQSGRQAPNQQPVVWVEPDY